MTRLTTHIGPYFGILGRCDPITSNFIMLAEGSGGAETRAWYVGVGESRWGQIDGG